MKKEYNFKNAKKGQVVPQKGKTRITIYLDSDFIEEFVYAQIKPAAVTKQ